MMIVMGQMPGWSLAEIEDALAFDRIAGADAFALLGRHGALAPCFKVGPIAVFWRPISSGVGTLTHVDGIWRPVAHRCFDFWRLEIRIRVKAGSP